MNSAFFHRHDSTYQEKDRQVVPSASSDANAEKAPVAHSGHINLTKFPIDRRAIELVPAKVVLHYKFMPLEVRDGVLKIAVNSLNNITLFDDLRIFLGLDVIPFLARETDIITSINQYYGIGAETIDGIIDTVFEEQSQSSIAEISETVTENITTSKDDEAAIVKFVNKILYDAYESRATDIHIEPYEEKLRIRYRVDGQLIRLTVPEELIKMKAAIISRLKIMAGLDIAERRLPQDGRIKIRIHECDTDVRISILPTAYGESVNIRLLTSRVEGNLAMLGFAHKDHECIQEIIRKPHGMLLVSGPTGSGKTSTLYTCLSKLNQDDTKIITIEDPVEYQLVGITQMNVKPKIGFDFSSGLRSILRHDPDVIMVGEIRDRETADISMRSALTGHFVLSTIHTNSAVQTITRLLDLGVEPYLIADALEGVIAQRLVRVVCNHCKINVQLSSEDRIKYGKYLGSVPLPWTMFQGVGCDECNHTGYKGRTVIYEMMILDKKMKSLISQRARTEEIHSYAEACGMKPLLVSGIEKVNLGITTLDEILSIACS